jgi:hypothetical protein
VAASCVQSITRDPSSAEVVAGGGWRWVARGAEHDDAVGWKVRLAETGWRYVVAAGIVEGEGAIGGAGEGEALFVHQTVMTPAEQCGVVERGLAAVQPVLQVVSVDAAVGAGGEAAAPITSSEGAAEGRRNGAALLAAIDDATGAVLEHRHHARIAEQASGRLRGNAMGRFRMTGQGGGIDMYHHLDRWLALAGLISRGAAVASSAVTLL